MGHPADTVPGRAAETVRDETPPMRSRILRAAGAEGLPRMGVGEIDNPAPRR